MKFIVSAHFIFLISFSTITRKSRSFGTRGSGGITRPRLRATLLSTSNFRHLAYPTTQDTEGIPKVFKAISLWLFLFIIFNS